MAGQTIEDVASISALLKNLELPSAAELLGAVERRQRQAVAAVERAARVHAWVVQQLATLLDPERLVVAGPLVEAEVYMAALVRAATELGGPALAEKLSPSTLGPFAGARGAAALAFQHWRPQR